MDFLDFLRLFGLGFLGAVIVIYIAKQQVIPEFRPLFDISTKKQEAMGLRRGVSNTREEIDRAQASLVGGVLPVRQLEQLSKFLDSSQRELDQDRQRLKDLEREIKQGQIVSRSIGFLLYSVIGGAIAAFISSNLTVLTTGSPVPGSLTSADLPPELQAIVIGGSWTGFLSVLGIRGSQGQTVGTVASLKKELADVIERAEREARDRGVAVSIDELKRMTDEKVDAATEAVDKSVKGVL